MNMIINNIRNKYNLIKNKNYKWNNNLLKNILKKELTESLLLILLMMNK